jgi:hypothetical protein
MSFEHFSWELFNTLASIFFQTELIDLGSRDIVYPEVPMRHFFYPTKIRNTTCHSWTRANLYVHNYLPVHIFHFYNGPQ